MERSITDMMNDLRLHMAMKPTLHLPRDEHRVIVEALESHYTRALQIQAQISAALLASDTNFGVRSRGRGNALPTHSL